MLHFLSNHHSKQREVVSLFFETLLSKAGVMKLSCNHPKKGNDMMYMHIDYAYAHLLLVEISNHLIPAWITTNHEPLFEVESRGSFIPQIVGIKRFSQDFPGGKLGADSLMRIRYRQGAYTIPPRVVGDINTVRGAGLAGLRVGMV